MTATTSPKIYYTVKGGTSWSTFPFLSFRYSSGYFFFTCKICLSSHCVYLQKQTTKLKTCLDTHLNRGLHLSIIPPPHTTNRCPRDHFWSLCFDPVSLLHEVGWGSMQSSRTALNDSCCSSMKSEFPKKYSLKNLSSSKLHDLQF